MGDKASRSRKLTTLADPKAELPTNNYKCVKGCTELYLAQRGIDEIANFEGLESLEVLWVNGNRIEKLDGLDHCFRIKELHAHNNRIRTLEGSSLDKFKFLHTLRLSDNKLGDFQTTLKVLGRLHHLEDLDLFGNPLEEEDNYRLHVVRAVPSLLVLDRHIVTDAERARAARVREEVGASSERKPRRQRNALVAGAPPQTVSKSVKMLFREVDNIRREAETKKKFTEERDLRLMDQGKHELLNHWNNEGASRFGVAVGSATGSLNVWEIAALEKYFRTLEDKPKEGVAIQNLSRLMAYLADRGFQVAKGADVLNTDHEIDRSVEHLRTLFSDPRISWRQFKQSLDQKQLVCSVMPTRQLVARAEMNFENAAALQKRLDATTRGEEKVKLAKEAHEAVQRGYHLSTIAERQSTNLEKHDTKRALSPLRTRYYAIAFTRAEVKSTQFHELDNNPTTQVEGDIGLKYKLHHKDFQKYMMKKVPPTTALVRQQLHM